MIQNPRKQSRWHRKLRGIFASNIRIKIILPYLILTLVVAVVGIYVVTSLVTSTLDERLTNQLFEAGRVVSDSLARRELEHLESARAVALTPGLAKALEAGDHEKVQALAQPIAVLRMVDCLIVADVNGQGVLQVLRQGDGSFERVEAQVDASRVWMVQSLLEAGDPNALPKRGLGVHRADGRYYYFTAIPVGLEDRVVGVVVVGTPLDDLLTYFKTTSLADVIVYLDDGRVVATTFAIAEHPTEVNVLLDRLSITPALYESALDDTAPTTTDDVLIRDRLYRLARGPLRVGNETVGVFSVALPSHFIAQARTSSRNTYTAIFTAAVAGVILIGVFISQSITRPLSRLVRTSQAVAEGDLGQRTGIVRADEIGMLAETFDEMTGRLSERTRALEEAVGRMRAILTSVGDGVLLKDLQGKCIPLNAAAEALLENMEEGFLPGPLRELPVGEYGQSSDLQSSPWTLDHRRFQVGEKVISAHSAAVRTDDGEHLGTVIVLRDVTAEVRSEQALREEAEQRRAILSSIGDGVVVLDIQGTVILVNQTAEDMMAALASVSEEDPIQRLRDDLALDQATHSPVKGVRIDLDNQVVEAVANPVRLEDNKILGHVIVMRDITDTIQAAEMAAHISHLEELDKQKTEFISIASHELRSPLTSAKTFIQNLLDGVYGKLGEEQAQRLEVVLGRIDDEIGLVSSLLDYSRLEAKSRPLMLESADVAAIARGIVQEFKPRAERKGITLSTGSLDTGIVLIDKRKIWRVLSNLLDNALKFTPSGGRVTVSAEDKDETVKMRVADTGMGIPVDQLERVFDKFYQLDSSTTRKFSGMGLGLAIAKEIIEIHGGTIWAESQPGVGSVFYFTLPKTSTKHPGGEEHEQEQP